MTVSGERSASVLHGACPSETDTPSRTGQIAPPALRKSKVVASNAKALGISTRSIQTRLILKVSTKKYAPA